MDLAAAVAELKRSTDTFGRLIREQAERIPDRVALKFEHESVTYGTYNDEVNRLAALLARSGVGAGTVVAILCQNSPRFLIALGATAKLGAVGALLNTHLDGAALTHVLRASGASIGVADAHAVPALAHVAGTHDVRFFADTEPGLPLPSGVASLCDALPARAGEPPPPDVRGADVFLYIYTSGTTGYPKPAIVRHVRFTLGGIGLAALLGLQPGETVYAPLPLYHGESLFVGFAPAFRSGGAFASRRAFSASAFLDDVRRHEAVAFVYVGELCRYLLRLPPTAHDRDHRLRVAAGAGLRADVWRAFQDRFGVDRIIEMYGATEGNVALQNLDGRVGSVGKPHVEGQVALARVDHARGELARDASGFCIRCDADEPGELLGHIGHGGGAMEYDGYTDRAATERKVLRSAFAADDAWFRSGDLLRRDADGYYYFVDRLGDTFRWKGENVATQEVADVLNGAPGVSETNVYGVLVPGAEGRAGMAAIVMPAGARFDGRAFYTHAARHLPRYALPAFVRLVGEMDVTGTLKQRKVSLADEGYDPARIADPLFVRDDAAGTFAPLTPSVLAEILAGRHRL
jgi:acyl-CoA synthetase (AMP-forming)/AMP-acid ligase II